MSYPKYLSRKSLEKRYRDAGIPESKIRFLKDLCLSSMNLYGAIHAEQLWEVYKELSEKAAVPKIQRKELYAALVSSEGKISRTLFLRQTRSIPRNLGQRSTDFWYRSSWSTADRVSLCQYTDWLKIHWISHILCPRIYWSTKIPFRMSVRKS